VFSEKGVDFNVQPTLFKDEENRYLTIMDASSTPLVPNRPHEPRDISIVYR
jgi:hypothetical protein